MPAYSQMPSLSQWQRDSSVIAGTRKDDNILARIDNIVEALERTKLGGESRYLYGELYFATNYWLKTLKFGQNPRMLRGREPSVRNLCQFAITKLAADFHVSIATLPNELEKYYGKGISADGYQKDSQILGTKHYMERAETNRFRILFKQGKAYQFAWPTVGPLGLVNSEKWHEFTAERDKVVNGVRVLEVDYAPFAMSMSRDIYMGPHMTINTASSEGKVGSVHSSWLAGTPVQCAGSLRIVEGVVTGLENNSGHYQPKDDHMVNVLELLRTVGVDLAGVEILNYNGQDVMLDGKALNGKDFLSERGNWERILARVESKPGRVPLARGLKAAIPIAPRPGAKLKKKYQCNACKRIFEASYAVTFCEYCHGSCRAA